MDEATAKALRSGNLMTPGSGTPWEDRDSLGLLSAFLKTAIGMLRDPGDMLDRIRRLNERRDALLFSVGCAIFWFVGVMIHAFIAWKRLWASPLVHAPTSQRHINPDTIDAYVFFLGWIVLAAIVAAAVVGLAWMSSAIYFNMVRGEDMRGRGTAELAYNCFVYCQSPSVLAIIPYAGPIIALVWGFYLVLQPVGLRMRVKPRGAIIAASVSTAAALLIMLAVLILGPWLWANLLGMDPAPIFDPNINRL
jgi:hypothetical protein